MTLRLREGYGRATQARNHPGALSTASPPVLRNSHRWQKLHSFDDFATALGRPRPLSPGKALVANGSPAAEVAPLLENHPPEARKRHKLEKTVQFSPIA